MTGNTRGTKDVIRNWDASYMVCGNAQHRALLRNWSVSHKVKQTLHPKFPLLEISAKEIKPCCPEELDAELSA